jgi:hypothetical protein
MDVFRKEKQTGLIMAKLDTMVYTIFDTTSLRFLNGNVFTPLYVTIGIRAS